MQQTPQISAGAFLRFGKITINLLYVEEIEITDNRSMKIYYNSGMVREITETSVVSFFEQYTELMPDLTNKEIVTQYFNMVMNKLRSDFPVNQAKQQAPPQRPPQQKANPGSIQMDVVDMQSHNARFPESDFPKHMKQSQMPTVSEE
jgi:hypothetical protein